MTGLDRTRRRVLEATAAGLALGATGTASATDDSPVEGPTVYFCARGGVRAIDVETGQGWYFDEGISGLDTSPIVVDGVCYFTYEGSGGARHYDNSGLWALDAVTGEKLWQFDEPTGWVYGNVSVMDGVGYFVSEELEDDHIPAKVWAIDLETGTTNWDFGNWEEDERAGPTNHTPTVADGHVIIPGWGEEPLYALDADTGEEVWRITRERGTTAGSSPTVVDGTVYHTRFDSSHNTVLYAVDAADGSEVWTFTDVAAGGAHTSPTIVDDTVYVGLGDTLFAFDAADGTEQWRFTDPARSVLSPTVSDGTVYVGSYDTSLWAVDAASGSLEWEFTEPEERVRVPTVGENGVVYAASWQDAVYGVDVETGERVFYYQFENEHFLEDTSPTYVSDPSGGHSDGSRVMLGTIGNHGHWRYADQTIEPTTDAPDDESDDTDDAGDGIPGMGVGAGVAGVAGAGYLYSRRSSSNSE